MLIVAIRGEEKQITYEICLDKGFGCLAQGGISQLLKTPISRSFFKFICLV